MNINNNKLLRRFLLATVCMTVLYSVQEVRGTQPKLNVVRRKKPIAPYPDPASDSTTSLILQRQTELEQQTEFEQQHQELKKEKVDLLNVLATNSLNLPEVSPEKQQQLTEEVNLVAEDLLVLQNELNIDCDDALGWFKKLTNNEVSEKDFGKAFENAIEEVVTWRKTTAGFLKGNIPFDLSLLAKLKRLKIDTIFFITDAKKTDPEFGNKLHNIRKDISEIIKELASASAEKNVEDEVYDQLLGKVNSVVFDIVKKTLYSKINALVLEGERWISNIPCESTKDENLKKSFEAIITEVKTFKEQIINKDFSEDFLDYDSEGLFEPVGFSEIQDKFEKIKLTKGYESVQKKVDLEGKLDKAGQILLNIPDQNLNEATRKEKEELLKRVDTNKNSVEEGRFDEIPELEWDVEEFEDKLKGGEELLSEELPLLKEDLELLKSHLESIQQEGAGVDIPGLLERFDNFKTKEFANEVKRSIGEAFKYRGVLESVVGQMRIVGIVHW
ncbi:MAG: hypothetical protein LBI95_00050, partial [Holosporales bacterium]|nr:hypothetical protein [Holosporales bacterium]